MRHSIRSATTAIVGSGNQGRSQAQNLRDSGLDVTLVAPPMIQLEQTTLETFGFLDDGCLRVP